MNILPIRFVTSEDSYFIGSNLVNLAKLRQMGFPVPDGLIITPPRVKFKSFLEHFQHRDKDHFEQSLTVLKKEFFKIPPEVEFTQALTEKNIDSHRVWQSLLEVWLEEIRNNFFRAGFSKDLNFLSCQPVFTSSKIKSFGSSFIDYEHSKLVCNVEEGKLYLKEIEELEEMIKKANKKLYMPYVYHWIRDEDGLKIIKLAPFTQNETTTVFNNPTEIKINLQKPSLKTALKLYLNITDFKIDQEADGGIVNYSKELDFDTKAMQLVESAITLFPKPVIYMLTDKVTFDLRGANHLIHNSKLLEEDLKVYSLAKEQKNMSNISLGIPYVRSITEFTRLKELLPSSSRFFLELAVPENLINLEKDYLKEKLEGVVFNLDSLMFHLEGLDVPSDSEIVFSEGQIKMLLDFIQEPLKILHKAGVTVLVGGGLSLHDEVQRFLIRNHTTGIISKNDNLLGRREQISFLEKHNFLHL